jgi:hypothetical protein
MNICASAFAGEVLGLAEVLICFTAGGGFVSALSAWKTKCVHQKFTRL